MDEIKAKKLIKGNTIGIIAVSGRIREYERIESAKKYFEDKGFNVVVSVSCTTSHRYMAGQNDKECLATLHNFFADDNIDAILCARGGYGTLRLLKNIDWNLIKNHPKIFAGYSDITILLNMIYKNTGLITFHSAMPNGDFSQEIHPYTEDSFFKTLMGNAVSFKAENSISFKGGNAQGKLWGGNLATLVSLCGIDFVPDENLILFLEDLNEPVYKIDKMLTQLFNVEKIRQNVKGIALGEFKDIENKDFLNDLLQELALDINVPMCDGFKITHGKIKDTIPVGASVSFDAKVGEITLLNNYLL